LHTLKFENESLVDSVARESLIFLNQLFKLAF
jgi:hypothetical protein